MLGVLLSWIVGQLSAEKVRNTFLAVIICLVSGVAIAYATTILWSLMAPDILKPTGTIALRLMRGCVAFPLLTLIVFAIKRGKIKKAKEAGAKI